MSSKLYDWMNWPDIEGIVYSECDNPHDLLGGHLCKDGFLIQVFRPDAVEISVKVEDKKKLYPMEKVDEAGYFAVLIPAKKKMDYTLTVENVKGKKTVYKDPYAFCAPLSNEDVKRFCAGTCKNAYTFMGSHSTVVDGVAGMRFAVWAPNAVRVGVIGRFNNWDGRLLQMSKRGDSGIFELFIPEFAPGTPYCYEVKFRNGMIAKKLDPYACKTVVEEDVLCSAAGEGTAYEWSDKKWLDQRKKEIKRNRDAVRDESLTVCELEPEDYMQPDIVDRVEKLGFQYVKLCGLFAAAKDTNDAETVGFYATSMRFLEEQDAKRLIDGFHKKNIGVLADWGCAYMGNAQQGLSYFDGTPLYETGPVRLNRQPKLNVSTFDYAKPQVRTFLYSNFCYLCEQLHLDGIVADEFASMLYLDYGRNAGEWTPNLYGGNENLAAVDFIKGLRKTADQCSCPPLLIAHDSSFWPRVTGSVAEDGLGFDYKFNDGWKKELLEFMMIDPLFRKGSYDKITYSMLYQYSEQFMLDLSHVNGGFWQRIKDIVPGAFADEETAEQNKCDSVKVVLAYMYTHPGKKLVSLKECSGCEEYVAALNTFYRENPALYEQDALTDGFEWIDNESAEESVLAYVRRAADGTELMTAVNFTPVEREAFMLGVTRPGKYTEVFNSKKRDKAVYCSEEAVCKGKEESIAVCLPPLGAVICAYTPYTDIELQERMILKEAEAAKKKAEEEARQAEALKRQAEELKRQADEQEKLAKEAEQAAKQAAKEALEAQRLAQQKALEADKTRHKIDEETKKKLEALNKIKKNGD